MAEAERTRETLARKKAGQGRVSDGPFKGHFHRAVGGGGDEEMGRHWRCQTRENGGLGWKAHIGTDNHHQQPSP